MTGYRRLFSKTLLIFLLLAAGLLAGCRAAGPPPLTIAVNSGVEGDALKQAARDYQAETGTVVQVAEFPYANLFEKAMIDAEARTGAYDLVMLDDPWFPRFAEAGHLTDLGPLLQQRGVSGADEDFVPASLALCRHPYGSGALHALPYIGNSQLLFYRRDLFEKHGLAEPQTWDDVLRAARVIHEREANGAPSGGQLYGYVMRAAQGNAVVADFMPIFWAFGAEMFDEAGRPTVNSPEAAAALRFTLELGRYAPPGYVSFNADEVAAHLLQGTAAMSINWPAWIGAFDDQARSRVAGRMAFVPLPGARREGRAEIGNWLLAIPRHARNQQAAADFLLWATSREQMKKSALRDNPPTRRSLFNDPELVAKFPAYPAQLRSLETSRPRPRTPLWNEIENAFGIYLSKAISGALSPEEALNQANEEIARIQARDRQ